MTIDEACNYIRAHGHSVCMEDNGHTVTLFIVDCIGVTTCHRVTDGIVNRREIRTALGY